MFYEINRLIHQGYKKLKTWMMNRFQSAQGAEPQTLELKQTLDEPLLIIDSSNTVETDSVEHPLVASSISQRFGNFLDILGGKFIFPVIAPFRLLFMFTNIVGSVFVQLGYKTLFDNFAAAPVNMILFGLMCIDILIGLSRSLKGNIIEHINPWIESAETVMNAILFVDEVSSNNSKYYFLGWLASIPLLIASHIGQEGNFNRVHANNLPFTFKNNGLPYVQGNYKRAILARSLQTLMLMMNVYVATSRTISTFWSSNIIRPIVSAGWMLITAGFSIGVTLLSTQNIQKRAIFKASLGVTFLNNFKPTLWQSLASYNILYSTFAFLLNQPQYNFNYAADLQTILPVILFGIAGLLAARKGSQIYLKNFAGLEMNTSISDTPPNKSPQKCLSQLKSIFIAPRKPSESSVVEVVDTSNYAPLAHHSQLTL